MTTIDTIHSTNVYDFGKQLILTEDLDPVYVLIHKNPLLNDLKLRTRFYLAYWCFYDIGVASYIADIGPNQQFWKRLMNAAVNEIETPMKGRWPRAAERRHFRGKKCVEAVKTIDKILKHNPKNIYDFLLKNESFPMRFSKLRSKTLKLPQFGPWVAFKIGDMLERLDDTAIDFIDADILMFREPTLGALLVWEYYYRDQPDFSRLNIKEICKRVCRDLGSYFRVCTNNERIHDKSALLSLAPPNYNRPINIQEVETVLCKWKAHMNGQYEIGKDTIHCASSLREWREYSTIAKGFDEPIQNLLTKLQEDTNKIFA